MCDPEAPPITITAGSAGNFIFKVCKYKNIK